MDESGVAVKEFSKSFLGRPVHFYILKLNQSFLIWIGTNVTFKSLAVGMQSRLVRPCVWLSVCPRSLLYCTVFHQH